MDLSDFLTQHPSPSNPSRECRTCARYPEVVAQLVEFMDKKRSGEVNLSVHYLHKKHLVPNLGYKLSYRGLRSHIQNCMGLNIATGESKDTHDEE